VVENKALGYILRLYLEQFSWENRMYNIAIQPTFEEMIPKNKKEKKKWEREREKAYNGSFRHFFTSLALGNCETEGFVVHEAVEETGKKFRAIANDIDLESLLTAGSSDLEKVMFTDLNLVITFCNETEEHMPGSNIGGFQETVLEFRDRVTRFYVDGYFPGSLFPVTLHGYLTNERVADFLPREYNPVYDRYRKK